MKEAQKGYVIIKILFQMKTSTVALVMIYRFPIISEFNA